MRLITTARRKAPTPNSATTAKAGLAALANKCWARPGWPIMAGKTNKVFCTTMGAATDLENEGLRRLLVNAVYWAAGLEVPAKADVSYVGDYKPSMYGFDGYVKGVKPEEREK